MVVWNRKTFTVITGASRGIGQAIAIQFSKCVAPSSRFLLLARTTAGLEETRSKILEVNDKIEVVTCSIDLSHPDIEAFTAAVRTGLTSTFDEFVLVQCAASLGIDQGYLVRDIKDVPYIRSYLDFNVTSFVLLNSIFCEAAGDSSKTIVHISSSGALQPFKTWGMYCAARAAKNMLLKSVAVENPEIRVLNYAPGVVDTENYSEALRYFHQVTKLLLTSGITIYFLTF